MRKKKKKLSGSLGWIILVISLLFNFFLLIGKQLAEKPEEFLVTEILGGDTFIVNQNQKVRLLDINAPDLEYCGRKKSMTRLQELILNKRITLREIRTDQYGKIIALVYTGKNLVNEVMMREGWGEYSGPHTPQAEQLKELNHQAKEKEVGIYQPECYPKHNLENPNCLIKENVSNESDRKIYSFPGCPNYEKTIMENFMVTNDFAPKKSPSSRI